MICPRCKEKNSQEDRVCKKCGLKLKTICPRCKEPNKLGQPKCKKCSLTLIRFCPKCKSPNFPHVKNCRKCGFEMLKRAAVRKKQAVSKSAAIEPEERIETSPPVEQPQKEPFEEKLSPPPEKEIPKNTETPLIESPSPVEKIALEDEIDFSKDNFKKELTRNETGLFLREIVSRSDKGYVIGIAGPAGIGKSTIVSALTQNIEEQQIIWLIGQCEPNKKMIPYAFFKDLICNLLGIPVLTAEKEELKKTLKKIFETNLKITDEKILNIVYRIVLNEYKDCSSSIEKNCEEIQQTIQKIINTLEQKANIVLIIEEFEHIDKASFDCIKYLLKNNFLEKRNFLIINHNNSTNLTKLFPEEVSSKKFLLILLKYLDNEELNGIILNMLNGQDILPDNLKYKILRQSKGLPLYVEQALWYLFQLKAIYTDDNKLKFNTDYSYIELDPDCSELFRQRLEMIEKFSSEAKEIILTAAVFGYKFIPQFVRIATGIEEQKMREILQILVNCGVFALLDQNVFSFKHINLYKIIYERALNNEKSGEISLKVLSVLENNIEFNNTFLARLSEYAGAPQNMLYYYNKAVLESFCLGDSMSYTDNQLKVYELLPEAGLTEEEKEAAKLAVSEQLGKVNYEINPAIATKYLSESIEKYEEYGDDVKLIELIGYLSKSCELKGDFLGVIDCAEKAINLTGKGSSSLEVILLDFPKTDAIFNLGRLEETIVTAADEILPALHKAISKNETLPGLTIDDLKTVEYETELTLAKALTFQGNKNAVELLNKIAAKAEKEKSRDYELKALLTQTLFSIIQGDIKTCENILESINEKGLSVNQSNETKLQWLFISILSNMAIGNFDQARNICYSTLALAKETKNYNIFALIKLLSGFFYQHFQYYKNATTIYEEIANYCSETKMATGALYAWYFSAEAELQTGNVDKSREIAEKALDVAHKPNVNNFIAIIILSKLLAEIKIITNDLEGAYINVESVLSLAENNDLHYLLIELYITLGKIYQERASVNKERSDYECSCAYRTYTKAFNIAEKLDNDFIIKKVEKVMSNLSTFCKLSGITLEK